MKTDNLDALMAKVAELGRVSQEDARKLASEIYDDGIVSRAEAEALFELNDKISGSDQIWDERFREAIKDFLLTVESPIGWVSDEECAWLMEQIGHDGRIGLETELDLLLDVLRFADGAPAQLGLFALQSICDHAAYIGRVESINVERIRRALYAAAGDGANWVTRQEAACLFKLNDAVGRSKNDSSWNDLFARAIGNHLMAAAHPKPSSARDALAREKWLMARSDGLAGFFGSAAKSVADGTWFEKLTFDSDKAMRARNAAYEGAMRKAEAVDEGEENWLVNRLGWDNDTNPAERALIAFLKREAPGFTDGIVQAA